MSRALAAAVIACTLVCAGGVSRAYVPTRTANDSVVHWPMSCIVLAPDARGDSSPSEIDIATIEETLERSVSNWNSRISDCSYMRLGAAPATIALEPVSDGRPSVVFRAERWGRGDRDYPPSAIGRTTVWFNTNDNSVTDGIISDADIELNAVDFTFSTHVESDVALPGTTLADLENTLTHEIGHVLGLGHTCVASDVDDDGLPAIDQEGNLVPSCALGDSLPDSVRNATMYPYASAGAINMRMPSDDDVRGVCDPYPIEGVHAACYGYIEGAGCALSPGPTGTPLGLILVATWAGARARSRRGRVRGCRASGSSSGPG